MINFRAPVPGLTNPAGSEGQPQGGLSELGGGGEGFFWVWNSARKKQPIMSRSPNETI